MGLYRLHPIVATLCGVVFAAELWAQPTAFTYQGELSDNGSPATGLYDLSFELFDVPTNGGSLAAVTNEATEVTGGLFMVTLDFGGGIFDGGERWLEIGVTTNGGGAFRTLAPRQRITSAPYAITASRLEGVVPSSGLSGTYSEALVLSHPDNWFAGDAGGLTNVDAEALEGLGADQFWQVGGNVGTAPETNYLGTGDDQPLDLRVNNQRGLRLEYATDGTYQTVNLIGGYGENSVGSGTVGAAIGGGGRSGNPNTIGADSPYSTIGGGRRHNIADDTWQATIAGGYEFEYTEEALAERLGRPGGQIGLIAQEVEKVFPDWVEEDEDGYKYVTERGTTALLVEALRELRDERDAQIEAQREQIAGQQGQIAELNTRLARLEALLGRDL